MVAVAAVAMGVMVVCAVVVAVIAVVSVVLRLAVVLVAAFRTATLKPANSLRNICACGRCGFSYATVAGGNLNKARCARRCLRRSM